MSSDTSTVPVQYFYSLLLANCDPVMLANPLISLSLSIWGAAITVKDVAVLGAILSHVSSLAQVLALPQAYHSPPSLSHTNCNAAGTSAREF